MNIAPFQDIRADDANSFADFSLAHAMAHEQIYNTLLASTVVIQHNDFFSATQWDKDWLLAHQQEHNAIYTAIGLTGLPDLSTVDLKNQDELEAWMEQHNQVHANINLTLNL
jgi:hypothetical protein